MAQREQLGLRVEDVLEAQKYRARHRRVLAFDIQAHAAAAQKADRAAQGDDCRQLGKLAAHALPFQAGKLVLHIGGKRHGITPASESSLKQHH